MGKLNELGKGGVNLFGLVKDYGEMLNRLAVFLFFITFIMILIVNNITHFLNPLNALLPSIVKIPWVGEVPFTELLVSATVAVIGRGIKLHDKISDIFNIRADFDVNVILVPIARSCEINITSESKQLLFRQRSSLMHNVFYKYVSSTDPQIDKHIIFEALDQWSWYWIIVENSTIWILVAIWQFYLGYFSVGGAMLLIVILSLFFVLPLFYRSCSKLASREIGIILNNNTWKSDIKEELINAL